MTTTNAQAVSRHLRSVGFLPVPTHTRDREGLRVTNSGSRVRVTADLDSPREAADLAVAARQTLIGAGFLVSAPDSPAAFYVNGRD